MDAVTIENEISAWAATTPEIRRAWRFGDSRQYDFPPASSIHIALDVTLPREAPMDGMAGYCPRVEMWHEQLQKGLWPLAVQLQLFGFDDNMDSPAIPAILLFDRNDLPFSSRAALLERMGRLGISNQTKGIVRLREPLDHGTNYVRVF